jgi:hypothetical protein
MNLYLYAVIERHQIPLDPAQIVLDIPQEHKSKKDILEIQELFQDPYNQIMKKYGFDYVEGAKIGALICAIITNVHCMTQKDLALNLAAGIVAMGFVEGTKTCPLPLRQ